MAAPYGAVYEYLSKIYNGVVRTQESVVNVGLTRTVITGNNPDRVELVIVNLGSESVFVFTAVRDFAAGQGIRIGPGGGQMSVNLVHDSVLPSLGWFGRSTVAANDVFVMEVVREATIGG